MVQQQNRMIPIWKITRIRLVTIAAMLFTVVLGLSCKYYNGPGQAFVNNWGPASICYEVLFVLLGLFIWPRRSAITSIAIGVCIATCLIEASQLLDIPWLQAARGTFLGRMLLGTSFSWWDFPAYPIGSWIGWAVARWIAGDADRVLAQRC